MLLLPRRWILQPWYEVVKHACRHHGGTLDELNMAEPNLGAELTMMGGRANSSSLSQHQDICSHR